MSPGWLPRSRRRDLAAVRVDPWQGTRLFCAVGSLRWRIQVVKGFCAWSLLIFWGLSFDLEAVYFDNFYGEFGPAPPVQVWRFSVEFWYRIEAFSFSCFGVDVPGWTYYTVENFNSWLLFDDQEKALACGKLSVCNSGSTSFPIYSIILISRFLYAWSYMLNYKVSVL